MSSGADVFTGRGSSGIARVCYYLLAITVVTITHTWSALLLYWVLPLLTFTQVIIRLGAMSEHKYNLPQATVEDSTPLIVPNWWERCLLPNLNFTFHSYHHFFPGVPFSDLPKVHCLFQQEGLVDERNAFRGYFSYLRFITTTKSS